MTTTPHMTGGKPEYAPEEASDKLLKLAEAQRDGLLDASMNVMTFYMGIIGGVTGNATRDALLKLQDAIALCGSERG